MRSISQKKIAELAGLSQAVVSHVLGNGRSNIHVSEANRKRILEIARENGYRPNLVARSLRTNKSGTIGIIGHNVSNIKDNISVAVRLVNQEGWELIPALTEWQAGQEDLEINRLLDRQIDGLIIISPAFRSGKLGVLSGLLKNDFPLVSIGVPVIEGMDYVDWDRRQATKELTEHLIKNGCRKFAYIASNLLNTDSLSPGNQQRFDGIGLALEQFSDTSLDVLSIEIDDTIAENSTDIMADLFEKNLKGSWPDAFICHTDLVAAIVISTARKMGKNVPRDITVAGCSEDKFSPHLLPPLTTIRMPNQQLIEKAVGQMFKKIQRKKNSPEVASLQEVLPAEIVIRQSSLLGCNSWT